MKIKSIETLVCNARMRNWIFVKVITDQPGLFGFGEATLEWHTRSVVGAIEDLSHLLVGEDPTAVEHIWQIMWRQHFWHGNGIVRATAIAGIDLCCGILLEKRWGCHVTNYGEVRFVILSVYIVIWGAATSSRFTRPPWIIRSSLPSRHSAP